MIATTLFIPPLIIHPFSSFFFSTKSSSTPEDWQGYTNENIDKAEKDRKCSVDLRAVIDSLLNTTANDMQQQTDDTNLAFDKRIRETQDTKGKLEDHLARVGWCYYRSPRVD